MYNLEQLTKLVAQLLAGGGGGGNIDGGAPDEIYGSDATDDGGTP